MSKHGEPAVKPGVSAPRDGGNDKRKAGEAAREVESGSREPAEPAPAIDLESAHQRAS